MPSNAAILPVGRRSSGKKARGNAGVSTVTAYPGCQGFCKLPNWRATSNRTDVCHHRCDTTMVAAGDVETLRWAETQDHFLGCSRHTSLLQLSNRGRITRWTQRARTSGHRIRFASVPLDIVSAGTENAASLVTAFCRERSVERERRKMGKKGADVRSGMFVLSRRVQVVRLLFNLVFLRSGHDADVFLQNEAEQRLDDDVVRDISLFLCVY